MNILNKGKPKHKRMNPRRQWRKLLTALAVAYPWRSRRPRWPT